MTTNETMIPITKKTRELLRDRKGKYTYDEFILSLMQDIYLIEDM